MKTGKVMIGNCSSAGRSLKLDRSSKAGKTLATTCKTKKAAAKSKPVAKAIVKKTAPKPVVKKVAVKPVVKKVATAKPKANKTTTKKSNVDKVYLTSISLKDGGRVGMFRITESVLERLKRDAPRIEADKIQELSSGTAGNSFDEITSRANEVYYNR
jgi:hypothetical protein